MTWDLGLAMYHQCSACKANPIDKMAGIVEEQTRRNSRPLFAGSFPDNPRMPPSQYRAVDSAMIPWIIALVFLFGAFTPDCLSGHTKSTSKDAAASQLADHAHLSGHSSVPLLKIPSIVWGNGGLSAPPSSLLRVGYSSDQWVRQSTRSVSPGRAPPTRPLA